MTSLTHEEPAGFITRATEQRTVADPSLLHYASLGITLLFATVLRFGWLAASSLWSDEGNTWALIQRSWSEIPTHAAADIHPPGYYWLLKAWSLPFGTDVIAMRSFSAFLGVLLVLALYAIGRQVAQAAGISSDIALLAAWLAAINPFQIYYSQEARMYMLLALTGCGLFLALLIWCRREQNNQPVWGALALFACSGALGFWTHYSFPILLTAAGVAYLWHWGNLARRTPERATWAVSRYTLANLIILLLYAPWWRTAIERVLNWPQGGLSIPWTTGLELTLRTLAFGPLRQLPEPLWPWLVGIGLLPLLGLFVLFLRPSTAGGMNEVGVTLGLWFFAPIGLMAALGLYSDAFLKFLLVASPAWLLLVAAAAWLLPYPRIGALLVAIAGAALAIVALPNYYLTSDVRDNYASVAQFIQAVGDPTTDLVLLNAPGQAEVWAYYDPGFKTIGLPQERPPDPAQTEEELAAAVADRNQIFALFWGEDEADPDHIIERWLGQHAFLGLGNWQGNMRFAVYTMPNQLNCRELNPAPAFGTEIGLVADCQPERPQTVAVGQTALVGLRWQTVAPLLTNYKVTLQLLDERNQVIAQHDGEPAGGSQPTDSWMPGVAIEDNRALLIPPGTPPGTYRLIVAMYDEATNVRLPTANGDIVELGTIEIVLPTHPLPIDVLPIQYRVDRDIGPVTLAGYASHLKGYSHAPSTPLKPGDLVQFTFLWQAPDPLPPDWPPDLHFTLTLGNQTLTAPLAGGNYPTAAWEAGRLVRGKFDLLYDGTSQTPELSVGDATRDLARLPR